MLRFTSGKVPGSQSLLMRTTRGEWEEVTLLLLKLNGLLKRQLESTAGMQRVRGSQKPPDLAD